MRSRCFANWMTRDDWCGTAPGEADSRRGAALASAVLSSEAALGVIGALGGADVRTLGVDGGRDYGQSFVDLNDVTTARQRATLLRPPVPRDGSDRPPERHHACALGPGHPGVRGGRPNVTSPRFEHSRTPSRSTAVCQYRSRPCSVTRPEPRARRNRARTPFSFAWFAIPELCGHAGRAIYLDSDMLVFGDINELESMPFSDAHVLCSRQSEAPAAWSRRTGSGPGGSSP